MKRCVLLGLALLGLAAIAPATASARCLLTESPLLCQQEETEEAAAYPPVESLEAQVVANHGHTYRHPGYSEVILESGPFGAHFGLLITTPDGPETSADWSSGSEEQGEPETVVRQWSCHRPHQVFTYHATAVGATGAPVSKTGTFHAQLTGAWCARARRIEIRAEEDRLRREEGERANREIAEAEREIANQRHFETNCRKLGGTPVDLTVKGQEEVVCKGPSGGIILVPH